MKEASSLHFHLVEHATNDSMSSFVDWIYTTHHPEATQRRYAYEVKRLHRVLHTWLLADYLQAREFQNFLVGKLPGIDDNLYTKDSDVDSDEALDVDFDKEKPKADRKPYRRNGTNEALRDFYFNALKQGNIRAGSGMYRFIIYQFAKNISHHTVEEKQRRSYFAALDPGTKADIAEYLAETCSRVREGVEESARSGSYMKSVIHRHRLDWTYPRHHFHERS